MRVVLEIERASESAGQLGRPACLFLIGAGARSHLFEEDNGVAVVLSS